MKNYQQKAVESPPKNPGFQAPPVSDYMATSLITFTPETPILEVVSTLLGKSITGAPVCNGNKELVGLIDDKDCLKVLFDSAYHNQPVDNRTVADYMTSVMKTITLDCDIYEVADIFLTTKYKRLVVLDDNGRLVGQISRADVLRAIHDLDDRAR